MTREIKKQRMFCFLLLHFGPESLVHENMETVDNEVKNACYAGFQTHLKAFVGI